MRVDLFDVLSALTLVFLTIPSTLADYPAKEDPSSLVNLFIGTINGGHVFPGEYAYTSNCAEDAHISLLKVRPYHTAS
jgi:hypothetical protein